MAIAIFLNHLKRSFSLVTDPYFQNTRIICGTSLDGQDVSASPGEAYMIDNLGTSKVQFFEKVRESFERPLHFIAKGLFSDDDDEYLFTMYNGVCTVHYDHNIKYIVQYVLEKGIKLNNTVYTMSDLATNTQIVRTVESAKRKDRYTQKVPKGESYDRIIVCLKQLGPMTTSEIANDLGIPENRVSGRISEMVKCGLICKKGPKTVDGRKQMLWALTGKKA